MLRTIEKYLDFGSLKDDLRKIGVTFITAGIVGMFLTHVVSLILSAWLIILGISVWFGGLYKKERD